MSKLTPEHTKTPWVYGYGKVAYAEGFARTDEQCEANAVFIVRACNEYDALRASHTALLKALRESRRALISDEVGWAVMREINAAIAAAEEIAKHV